MSICTFAAADLAVQTDWLASWSTFCAAGLFAMGMLGFWTKSKPADESVDDAPDPSEETEPANPIEKLIREGRTAIALRATFSGEIIDEQLSQLQSAFLDRMAFVHPGRVRVDSWILVAEQDKQGGSRIEFVEAFWMDRTPVTNSQYGYFVRGGGYDPEGPWWPPEARPLISQFVDQTGTPGPQGWQDGGFDAPYAGFPVVGVSWYEAAAYAAWAGKRLPSDPEWVKAATWPIDSSGTLMQRTFPWGEHLHSRNARLWNEAGNELADVSQYGEGANPCGVTHLIVNVWEWLYGAFGDWDEQLPFPIDPTMAAIRGGAFDTYFQSQATAQFCSGEPRANRRANIGFRCVVPASEVNVEVAYRTTACPTSPPSGALDASPPEAAL